MNVICFTGNIGRDGETRFTANGDAVLSFSAALISGYGDKKIITWLNCALFGKRAESLAPYIKKGSQVAINGEFTARPYKSKDGTEKLSLDVRVNDLTLLGGKAESSEPAKAKDQPAFDDFEDDLPF